MSKVQESTALAVVEPAKPLMTIEPVEYVAQVFEPFAKRLADAKALAVAAEFDVTTTAGMAVAVKHRATFREIRVASEKARKERKAPILEIGKLLDSRQKEIEAEIEPFESRFDDAIKAEEQRKESEKVAKLLAEKIRVDQIRARIDLIRSTPARFLNKPSAEIGAAADHLSETVISLDEYQEFCGECQVERDHAVRQMREMQANMVLHEAEQARVAAEREALAKERAEAAERERVAEAERQAQAKRDREELAARQAEIDRQEREAAAARAAQEAEQRAAQERAAAVMRAELEAHRRVMAERQAELDRQQAAVDAERQRQADEAARVEREKQEAIETAQRIEAEKAEEALRAQQEQAARMQRESEARAEAERLEAARREYVEFEANGPGDSEMCVVLADHYDVSPAVVVHWLAKFDSASFLTPTDMEKAA